MNFPKKTRKALYEAKGPIWINWPEGTDPHPGKRYAVYSEEDGSRLFSVRVEKTKERGAKALVRIDNDPVRILPGLQGVRNEQGNYEPEPERIDEVTENRYAMEGRTKTGELGAEHRVGAKRASKERQLAKAEAAGREKTIEILRRVMR